MAGRKRQGVCCCRDGVRSGNDAEPENAAARKSPGQVRSSNQGRPPGGFRRPIPVVLATTDTRARARPLAAVLVTEPQLPSRTSLALKTDLKRESFRCALEPRRKPARCRTAAGRPATVDYEHRCAEHEHEEEAWPVRFSLQKPSCWPVGQMSWAFAARRSPPLDFPLGSLQITDSGIGPLQIRRNSRSTTPSGTRRDETLR